MAQELLSQAVDRLTTAQEAEQSEARKFTQLRHEYMTRVERHEQRKAELHHDRLDARGTGADLRSTEAGWFRVSEAKTFSRSRCICNRSLPT